MSTYPFGAYPYNYGCACSCAHSGLGATWYSWSYWPPLDLNADGNADAAVSYPPSSPPTVPTDHPEGDDRKMESPNTRNRPRAEVDPIVRQFQSMRPLDECETEAVDPIVRQFRNMAVSAGDEDDPIVRQFRAMAPLEADDPIIAQFSGMQLANDYPDSTSSTNLRKNYDPVTVLHRLSPAGQPEGFVVSACLGALRLAPSLDWYYLHDREEAMCSRCYLDHVAGTWAAKSLTRRRHAQGSCAYGVPRVRTLLRAVRSTGMLPLLDYYTRKADIPPCPESALEAGILRNTWYTFGSFTICRSCHEDYIASTPFAQYFRHDPYPSSSRRCLLAKAGFARALRVRGAGDPESVLNECRRAASARASECSGKPVAVDSTDWFTLKSGPKLILCRACHFEFVANTRFEDKFAPYVVPRSHLNKHALTHYACGWRASRLSFAFDIAVRHGDWATFQAVVDDAAEELQAPSGRMYSLSREAHICERCRITYLVPAGLSHLVRYSTTTAGCAMCRPSRLEANTRVLLEAVETCDWEYFLSGLKHPSCQGPQPRKEAQWWGWRSLTICSACWSERGRGSSLEPLVALRGETITDGTSPSCYLYAPWMRALWDAACESGDITALRDAGRRWNSAWYATWFRAWYLRNQIEVDGASGVESPQEGADRNSRERYPSREEQEINHQRWHKISKLENEWRRFEATGEMPR